MISFYKKLDFYKNLFYIYLQFSIFFKKIILLSKKNINNIYTSKYEVFIQWIKI